MSRDFSIALRLPIVISQHTSQRRVDVVLVWWLVSDGKGSRYSIYQELLVAGLFWIEVFVSGCRDPSTRKC